MNLGQAEKQLRQTLNSIYGDGESAAIAALVLEDCVGVSHAKISLQREDQITKAQEQKLNASLQRLLNHEPVQYITQKVWFYGMQLYVDKAVLIPRPETEELVDWIVKDVEASRKNVFHKDATDADLTTELKILDIGTGSGCMALALKKTMPKAEVWGCDVSEEALNVARRNGALLNVRVDFQGIDFLDEARQKLLPTVDIIVSNPPYIPLNEKESIQPNVVAYEPHIALFVPDNDELIFYKAIAHFSTKRLYPYGTVYLEIHESFGKDVVRLFEEEGYAVELKKDMQGKDRMVKAVRRET